MSKQIACLIARDREMIQGAVVGTASSSWHDEGVPRSVAKKRGENPRRQRRIRDLALVVGTDGGDVQILRRRSEDAAVEAGVLRPLQEGKPINGEIVSLRQRPEFPLLFDVKTELPDTADRTQDGPPQIATDAYRKGWDAIWGQGSNPVGNSDKSLN